MKCECETEPIRHELIIEFRTKSCENDGEAYICNLMTWIHAETGICVLTGSWSRGTSANDDGTTVPAIESLIKLRVVSDSHNIDEDIAIIRSKLEQTYMDFIHEYYPKTPLIHERIIGIKINTN